MTELFNQALQAQLANKLTLALTLYKQLLATQPTHKDSLFNAGLICAQIQDFNQAIYYLSQAASIQKNAAICSLLGLSYMNTQQSKKAIAYYQEAIIFDDQEYMAHNHLGILYCQNHEYKKGIQYLKKAIQINP
ncbi:MAG TPA: tetratricopeptide repeat protein, partial [Agitococcus sp.]|nr:tetratricopeptide repeat protein [Agitococcus sp.]